MIQVSPQALRHAAADPDDIGALSDATRTLAAWNAASEGAYLSVGDMLQAMYDMLRSVERAMESTIDIMTGPPIARIDACLQAASDQATALEGTSRAIGERLAEVIRSQVLAQAGNRQVRSAFAILDYVTLVARTHCSGLNTQGSDLTSFLGEVEGLIGTGRTLAGRLSDCLDDLRASLEHADSQLSIRQFHDDRNQPLAAVIASLDGDLAKRRQLAAEMRDGARLAFGTAARSVAEVVEVLQFHDIARQRLEHTVDHLQILIRLSRGEGLRNGETAPDAPVRRAYIARIADLERAQLTDLAKLYEARMAVIGSALDMVLHQARHGADLVGLMLMPERSARGGDADLGITRQAEALQARFRQGQVWREAISTALGRCITSAAAFATMTDELDDIEFWLRLAGFNAAIHAAARHGGDKTIGYIAHEIRDNAANAKAGATRIRGGLTTTTHAATELQCALLPAEIQGSEGILDLLAEILAGVTEAEQDCLAHLARAEAAAAGVPDKVEGAKLQMQGHLQGLLIMQNAIETLEILAADMRDDGVEIDLSDLAAFLCENYTMREERIIFDAIFTERVLTELTPSHTVPVSQDADDLSDVLF